MRIALVLLALAAALAVVLGFVATRGGKAVDFRGSEPPEGLMLPDFEVGTASGETLRSADLRGRAVAVTFLDTQCTEACPILAAQMGQAMRALGKDRSRVVALAFSVDPVNDTPARIRSFLERYQALGLVRYVDGSVAELRPVWKEFKILASHDTGQSNMHSAPVRVYDGEGRWRSTLHPRVDLSGPNLAHDLRTALAS
ncbi:MAG: SCO family protein [Actinobacteria bacterium]|nr:SCO family protein [Actinomycetota bacterium]